MSGSRSQAARPRALLVLDERGAQPSCQPLGVIGYGCATFGVLQRGDDAFRHFPQTCGHAFVVAVAITLRGIAM